MSEAGKPKSAAFRSAVKVIIIFGLISLFGDMVYESMRGSSGQYMNALGIEMTQFALILGIGEFLAYALRLAAGIASDKSRKYWWFIYAGYGMLIVVPLMGVTSYLPAILAFMMLERIGKALRNPAKDTILSHVADGAGGKVGMGFAFGLQEALDKFGAFLGPLIFTAVFFAARSRGVEIGAPEYRTGYRLLAIPFVLLMIVVAAAHRKVNKDKLMEVKDSPNPAADKIRPVFWTYTAFTFMSVIGFAQFPLIAYHLKANEILPDERITLFYSLVMAVNALSAPAIGVFYDRVKRKTENKHGGLLTLLFIPAAAAVIPFLTLGRSVPLLLAGLFVFGAVLAAHETIMRSVIADITPLRKRGTGYGIFNAAFGCAALIGTSAFAQIYERLGIPAVQTALVAAQAVAMVFFLIMRTQINKKGNNNEKMGDGRLGV